VLVLHLRGELDVATVPLVQETVDRHAAGRAGLIVDLGALEFLDAAGLRLMVELRRRHGRQLAFGQPTAPVGRVLDISGLRGAFYWLARPRASTASAPDRLWPPRRHHVAGFDPSQNGAPGQAPGPVA